MTEHTLDAKDISLGRLASQAAGLLRGKDRVDFKRHQLPEISVRIINANQVKLTGDKWRQKVYRHHSGYPGGLKEEQALHLKDRLGVSELIRKSVYGMLPDNRLRDKAIKRLKIEE